MNDPHRLLHQLQWVARKLLLAAHTRVGPSDQVVPINVGIARACLEGGERGEKVARGGAGLEDVHSHPSEQGDRRRRSRQLLLRLLLWLLRLLMWLLWLLRMWRKSFGTSIIIIIIIIIIISSSSSTWYPGCSGSGGRSRRRRR